MARLLKLLLPALLLAAFTSGAQITVTATVDHLIPDYQDTLGGFKISATGGNGTYTYSWTYPNGSSSTKDLLNVKANSYTLNVGSQGYTTVKYEYSLGYKVQWGALCGTTFRNDSLKNTMLYPLGTSLSKNSLLTSENGWLELVLRSGIVAPQQIGFLDSAYSLPGSCGDIDFGVTIDATKLQQIKFNVYSTASPTVSYKAGDVLKIERIGSVLNYRLNGNLLWTVSNPNVGSKTWKIRTAVDYRNTPFINVGCSFRFPAATPFGGYMQFTPLVTHCSDVNIPNGAIQLSYNDPSSAQITWQNGLVGPGIQTLSPAAYSCAVADNFNQTGKCTVSVGYKAYWRDFLGTWSRNDSLKNTGLYIWGSATSRNVLKRNTNGWVEVVLRGTSNEQVGLLDSAYSVNSQTDMDFGYYKSSNYLQRIVNGVYTNVGYWREGDVVRLERNGNVLSFKLNGVLSYSVTDTKLGAKDLRVKAAVYTTGGPVVNIGCSFTRTLEVSTDRMHVDQSHALGGVAILNVSGGQPPYRVKWPDGLVSNYRNDLVPGIYRVRITDLSTDSLITYPTIGFRPDWRFKTNLRFSPDTAIRNRTDSLGVALSGSKIAKNKTGWLEMSISSLSDDILIGLVGDLNDLASQTETYTTTFKNTNTNNLYQLMKNAVANTLSYTSGTLNPGAAYDKTYCVRLKQGVITILMKGAPQASNLYYNVDDVIKISRGTSGQISLLLNDQVVFTLGTNSGSEYLHTGIVINSNSKTIKIGSVTPEPNNPSLGQVITYARPGLKPDGGYYTDMAGNIYFILEGEYNTSSIKFKVYDKTNAVVLSENNSTLINSSVRNLGDNRYTLNVSGLNNGYYLLEASNEKSEKVYMRFKRQVNTGGTGTYSNN